MRLVNFKSLALMPFGPGLVLNGKRSIARFTILEDLMIDGKLNRMAGCEKVKELSIESSSV